MSVGRYTFAKVDTINDKWEWAIVRDYEGPQDYGYIICAFAESLEPTIDQVEEILHIANSKEW
jgi:hypothetical protein